MTSRTEAQAVLARLRAEAPSFGSPPSRVLEWLVGEIPLGGTSLEVGCGWSTLALGRVSDRHVAVAPDPAEHEALRRWAKEADVGLDTVELHVVRPELDPGSLDLVLVAGDPAHPHPALALAATAPLVRTGGLLAVERTRIRSVAEPLRWLRADTATGSVRHRVDDAVVLQRLAPEPATPRRWSEQPGNGEAPSLEHGIRVIRRHLGSARR